VTPKKGLKGLVENWQSDLLAGLSVSLVALPLTLGIALAAGVPPMSGVLSAVIGGLVCTFIRGSHVAINGPGAGLIAVIISALAVLEDGTGQTLNYLLAAIVMSGAIQVVLGLLRMGKFADLFHSTVIQGILAAIGIIIFAKQIHIAMGITNQGNTIIETLLDAIKQIPNIHPFVGVISLLGLVLLVFHSRINYRIFHFLPAPMWVLVISIPFVFIFDFPTQRSIDFLGSSYEVGPSLLISIPANILDAIVHPNFSKINTMAFWTSVLSITIISSIESLASTKAVDKLDPYKRKSDLNKDLFGVGLSTMVSGMLGGLPVMSVIVRSTVNIHNHAKTNWSNFFHGALLITFVVLMSPIIQKVPLCALAIILVYTGFKLASPSIFKNIYDQGIEQLVFFTGTLVLTLTTNLLIGLFGGLLLTLLSHMLLAKLPIREFFNKLIKPGNTLEENNNGDFVIIINGVANFLSTLSIDKLLSRIPQGRNVNINLMNARLVDYSILEHLFEFQRNQISGGGQVSIIGHEHHHSSSDHKMALKFLTDTSNRMSPRQKGLLQIAEEKKWDFEPRSSEDVIYFESFDFFKSRPIEYKYNVIKPLDAEFMWEIMDFTFDEGAFLSLEEFHTTMCLVRFPFRIPVFTIEQKGRLERIFDLPEHKDIDYRIYHDFSHDYIVKVDDVDEMDQFLNEELKQFLESGELAHIESNGEAVLMFNRNLRLARVDTIDHIVEKACNLQYLVNPTVLT
jgi:MFS superfamily sulfate permease-like transporter